MSANPSISAPTDTRIFKKSFIKQYGMLFGLVPFSFLLIWLAFASPQARTASLVECCSLHIALPHPVSSGWHHKSGAKQAHDRNIHGREDS